MNNNIWYNVVLFPVDLEWHGALHACEVLDSMENETPVFWSQSKKAALAAQAAWSKKGYPSEIFETYWNPVLQIDWTYRPNTERAVQALLEVLA
jgi:hypothetical protein